MIWETKSGWIYSLNIAYENLALPPRLLRTKSQQHLLTSNNMAIGWFKVDYGFNGLIATYTNLPSEDCNHFSHHPDQVLILICVISQPDCLPNGQDLLANIPAEQHITPVTHGVMATTAILNCSTTANPKQSSFDKEGNIIKVKNLDKIWMMYW